MTSEGPHNVGRDADDAASDVVRGAASVPGRAREQFGADANGEAATEGDDLAGGANIVERAEGHE